MASNFVQAKSDNLPMIDSWMIAEYFSGNICHSAAEIRGVKEKSSGRQCYGDAAIGFVELQRSGKICEIRCKISPEHRVRSKLYFVSMTIDELKNQVVDITCHDCAASAGGCKHTVAFLMWIHRRSVEPSPTSTECYWRKPKLAGVGTSIECLSSKDLGAEDIPQVEDGDNFFEEIIQTAGCSKCNSELLKIYQPASPVEQLDLHLILIKFKEDLANDFLMYASNIMTEELCIEASLQTQQQYKNKLWFKLRYSRVTASKIYDVAHCRKTNGVIVEQILGAYKLRDTVALERGRLLENEVLKIVEETTKLKLIQSGLVLSTMHPIFGASPDAISEDYVAEIKCPTSAKAKKRYSTQSNKITAKFNAQVQLQMHMCKKNKALFCIADPEFEKNNKVTIITVDYDKCYIEGLMKKAESFWVKNVLPTILRSV